MRGVEMKWITPTHLDLAYKGQRTLDFQAVKCAGIDISVRDVSGGTILHNTGNPGTGLYGVTRENWG